MVVVFVFRCYRIAITQHLAIDTLGTLFSHKLYTRSSVFGIFSFVFILNTVSQLVVLCLRLLKPKTKKKITNKLPSSAYIRLHYSIESAYERHSTQQVFFTYLDIRICFFVKFLCLLDWWFNCCCCFVIAHFSDEIKSFSILELWTF